MTTSGARAHLIYTGELAQELGIRCQTGTPLAREVLSALVDVVAEHLLAGHTIHLARLGRFYCKRVGARSIKIPSTGAAVPIEAHACPAWQPAPALKEKIRALTAQKNNPPGRQRRATGGTTGHSAVCNGRSSEARGRTPVPAGAQQPRRACAAGKGVRRGA